MKTASYQRSLIYAILALFPILIPFFLFQTGCNRNSAPESTLRIWYTEVDPKSKEVMDEIAIEFEKENPGVSVEHDAVPWGELNKKLVASLSTGDVPDLTHLQPFMTASLKSKDLLLPISDVVDDLKPADIFPAVRDLQKFDGEYYGIAYAIGTTYFAIRTDLLNGQDLAAPKDWSEMVSVAKKLTVDNNNDGIPEVYGVVLPGDPFFIDQLTVELLSSNGGTLTVDGKPNLDSPQMIEVLNFWKSLSQYAPPGWTNGTYLEQFPTFASGKVAMVPVFYGRALKNVEKDADPKIANSDHFGFFPQPAGPSGTKGFATMDCENWSILKGAKNPELAKKFLKKYYESKSYAKYCRSVPIHLTPSLLSVAKSQDYLSDPMIKKWGEWQDETSRRLEAGEALPVMMSSFEERNVPYLMELQGGRIITQMVLDVCIEGKSAEKAAQNGQESAVKLVERLGYLARR